MEAPYRYDGLEASSYDAVDELADFNDYPFYRLIVDSHPGPVLDLGCGTGRILIPLAEDGDEIIGFDQSESMLGICQSKLERLKLRAKLVQGDMRRFRLEQRFATILVPGFSFQMLLERKDQIAFLESCKLHLNEGDQLALPMYFPWDMLDSGYDEEPMELRKDAPDEKGGRVVAYQGWRIDRDAQILELSNRYQRLDRHEKVVAEENKSMRLRWEMPYDMQLLLSQCGFSEIELYGDFEMQAPEPKSEAIIYVARR